MDLRLPHLGEDPVLPHTLALLHLQTARLGVRFCLGDWTARKA
jgi:hypothetical protein